MHRQEAAVEYQTRLRRELLDHLHELPSIIDRLTLIEMRDLLAITAPALARTKHRTTHVPSLSAEPPGC